MSSKSGSKQRFDDILECPICLEAFTDPRSLPCVHTFCFKCINQHCKDKAAGEKVPCPMCRKEFVVSESGTESLPKNFFVGNMIYCKHLLHFATGGVLCEVCSADGKYAAATMFCVECQEKQCTHCSKAHKNYKVSKFHRIVAFDDKLTPEVLTSGTHLVPKCDKHKKKLKSYCIECRKVICMLCYIEKHSGHKCSSVADLTEEFRLKMLAGAKSISEATNKCRELLNARDEDEREFIDMVTKVEKEICDTTERLKLLIENHKQKALEELTIFREGRKKQLSHVRDEIEQRMTSLESLRKYTDELVRKGSATEIANELNGISSRTDELVNLEFIEGILAELGSFDVFFTPAKLASDDKENNVVGTLISNVIKKATGPPRLICTIPPSGNDVTGLTVANGHLYVARYPSTAVDVYDTVTFKLQGSIQLSSQLWGLASCTHYNCLYAAGHKKHTVHRLDLATDHTTTWTSTQSPYGLSVNKAHNVLVASSDHCLLTEYSTNGSMIRCINVQLLTSGSVAHAVELNTGRLLVSYGRWQDHFSVGELSPDGKLRGSYGDNDKTAAKLVGCNCLAIDKNDNILVADWSSNGRIVVLDSSLNYSHDLPLPNDLQGPFVLYFDEAVNRLYIGERRGKRTQVYDNVRCCKT